MITIEVNIMPVCRQRDMQKMKLKMVFINIKKDVKDHGLAIVLLAVYCAVMHILFETICPVAAVTGFPCPGCGITRAFSLLFTLHFAEAFRMHACIVLWVPLIIWMLVRRWVFGKKGFPVVPLIVVTAITLGYYVFRMVTVYPGEVPMIFREKNLINMVMRAAGM